MNIPHCSKANFEINGKKFSYYRAQDAHGSGCKSFYVNEQLKNYDDFCKEIVNELKESGSLYEVISAINRYKMVSIII